MSMYEKIDTYSQAGQDIFVTKMLDAKKCGSFLEIGAGHLLNSSNTYLLEKKYSWTGYSVDLKDVHTEKNYNEEYSRFWKTFYSNVKSNKWPDSPKNIIDLPLSMQKECIELHKYNEFVPKFVQWQTDRPNTVFLQKNALDIDYSFLPKHMDYLQIDIDPPLANLTLLEKILPYTKFCTVTFEHDLWRGTDEVKYVRSKSREIMQNYGYKLIVNDVCIDAQVLMLMSTDSDATFTDPMYFEDWYVHPDLVNSKLIEKYSSITDQLVPTKYWYKLLLETENES